MIELENKTNLQINEKKLDEIASMFVDKTKIIELIITSNEEIREINKNNRGIDKATDVLSFPYEPSMFSPIGSIIISKDFVEQKAKEFNHSNIEELSLLFIHGLLHILGYDHEVDNGQMRQIEHETIKKLNLPNSLIIRTQG